MKILSSLSYFPLPGTGTGNSVYGFAKGLLSTGADVCVLAEGDKYEKSHYEGVPYIKFKKNPSKNPFQVSIQLFDYFKENKEDIDLLILNGIYVPYMYSLGMFAKKLGIPYIHFPHSIYNDVSFTKSKFKKKIYFYFFEKKLIENALAVQIFSENQILDLKKLAVPKNTISLPNGIDKKNLIINKRKNIKLDKTVKIIFLGRKEIITKGLDILIEAFSEIDSNIELYIQGSDYGETHKIEKLILDLNIKNIFLKDHFKGDIFKHLKEYDILVMPSRYEAFSNAVVEGMLSGLPIIVSMLGMKEQWEVMGSSGQEYLIENLTWNDIGSNAILKYKEFIESIK